MGFPRSHWKRLSGLVPRYAPAVSPWLRRRPSPWPRQPSTHFGRRVLPELELQECAPQPRPYPPDWSGWVSLEGLYDTGFSRTPSCLASRARAVWQYQHDSALSGLLAALTPVPEVELPSASMGLLRQTHGSALSSLHVSKAPRGAQCHPPTFD